MKARQKTCIAAERPELQWSRIRAVTASSIVLANFGEPARIRCFHESERGIDGSGSRHHLVRAVELGSSVRLRAVLPLQRRSGKRVRPYGRPGRQVEGRFEDVL